MNVKRMRKESTLTQEEFWGRIGISQSGGSRYERGRNVPEPVRILLTLAYGSDRERQAALHALTGNRSRASATGGRSPERSHSGTSATHHRS
jgi:transcriptional regulator with XRE-family HTH domain